MTKAADKFLQLCVENEQLPDVFEFLSSQGELSDRAQVDVLLVDQFQRWKNNQTIPVDYYLERTPDVKDILKVELLIEEYGYLDQRGVAPSAEEFAKRFHILSPAARRELYDALELGSTASSKASDSGAGEESGESEEPGLPEVIGRYHVVRMLGEGAFGKVLLARDPDLDRPVAIKIPTAQRIRMGGGVEEFLNEARAVAKLDHPNIVPVFDCGVTNDGDRCFVVSKYVRGKELRTEIRKGIPHFEAARIVGTLARALHVAHVAGIVHRDVKPGNVIIDSKRCPHLLDFGLALRDQDASDSHAFVGTPAYMSPEQARGGVHRVDGRSDVYSLAVVFYEMLTGHRPCKSDKAADVIEQIKQGEARPPRQSDDTIPVELERICLKALSRELSGRYSTAKDMADDLDTWLTENRSSESGDSWGASSGESSADHASGSSVSGGFGQSSRKDSWSTNTHRSPVIAFLKSPVTLGIGALLLGLWAIVSFTKPPWDVPGANDREPVLGNMNSETQNIETSSPGRLAVLGFRNISDNPQRDWLATGLTELLTSELSKSDGVDVLASYSIRLAKSDLDLADTETLGKSTLQLVNQRLGARWVVLGSWLPAGEDLDQIRLDVVVQDTLSDSVPVKFSRTVGNDDWLELIPETGAQVRKLLGLTTPDLTLSGQIGYYPLTNADANQPYYDGLAALMSFELLDARSNLEKAAELDPESAAVQDRIAEVMTLLGDEQSAREFSRRAVELADGMPSVKRLPITGRHHLLEGRPAEAVAVWRELCELRKDGVEEKLRLASAMIVAGQGRAALVLLEEMREKPIHESMLARVDLIAAEAAQSISEFALQIEYARNAIQLAEKTGSRLVEGRAGLMEGEARRRTGEHQVAAGCFDRATELLMTHGDRHTAAKAIGAWGKSLVDNGELDAAEQKIRKGLELAEELGNQRLLAQHTGQLGELAIYRGKFEDATLQLGEALASFEKLGDRSGIANMNLTLANVLARRGEPDKAIKMIRDARKAFQASGDRRGEARTWGQQGAVHGRSGEIPEAQRHFERALELFREVGDRTGEATSLGDLASTFSNQGDLKKAGELYSEALELHRQMASKRGPALVMYNLGVLYLRTGRIPEARKLIAESLANFERQGNQMNACFVQRKLGEVELLSGDLAQSRMTLDAALANSRKVGSAGVESQALASLGKVAAFEGRVDDAIDLQEQSKELQLKLKQDFNAAASDMFLCRLAMQQDRCDDALKILRPVVSELSRGKPDWKPMILAMQAQLEAKLGDHELAAATLRESEVAAKELASQDVSIGLINALELARGFVLTKRYDDALGKFDDVIAIAKEQGAVSTELEAVLDRFTLLTNHMESNVDDELTTFVEKAKELGFTDISRRAGALAGQSSQ